jgi:UDP-perosamine 4-acetyltransferase
MGESRIVIIGAGGHAKVVMEIIRSGTDGVISGLTDRDPRSRWLMGAEVLGDDSILPSLFADGVRHAFVALGDNRARMVAARKALALGFDLVNAVSPHAMISPSVRMGRGVAIMAGAMINADTVVEDLVIVNTGAVVDHDASLGEGCHVGSGAVLAGSVRIGAGALLGAGSTVVPGRSVGAGAIVGAGACVIDDLAPDVVAVGVPARVVRSLPGRAA